MPVANSRVLGHEFLKGMYDDPYFPAQIVDKGKAIMLAHCASIEAAGSEIETVARETICEDFWFIASAYGFPEADIDELTADRDW